MNSPVKEPWQMRAAEWMAVREEVRPCYAQSKFTRNSASQAIAQHEKLVWLVYGVTDAAKDRLNAARRGEVALTSDELEILRDRINTPVFHKDVVMKALSEGKPVPAEVLSDYPDLQNPGCVAPTQIC